jgi:hypothetical protein
VSSVVSHLVTSTGSGSTPSILCGGTISPTGHKYSDHLLFENLLFGEATCRGLEITQLDADSLVEQRHSFDITRITREKRCSGGCILGRDVASDGTAFEKDEPIVLSGASVTKKRLEDDSIEVVCITDINIGHLSEWLILRPCLRLVLLGSPIRLNKLIWNIFLVQNHGDTTSTRRHGGSI